MGRLSLFNLLILLIAILSIFPLITRKIQAFVPEPYIFETKWFQNMPVDHFSFDDNRTFSMRYLINDTFYDKDKGAVLFYCGNEGDITLFANNTGFMWDIAPSLKSMVIFAEHRFYGETMPFGKESFGPLKNVGKLSSEQALADFAVFLDWFKSSRKDIRENTPIIAFGGSYGGMLAAWMRIKYPHVIAGALASSAPILQFTGLTDCGVYNTIVTGVFNKSGTGCSNCIKQSWPIIRNFAKTDDGRNKLNKIFQFCPDSRVTSEENATQVVNWLADIWGNVAMINYPYPTNFLNPVPAWPIKAICSRLRNCPPSDKDPEGLLTDIFDGVSVFMNYTGSVKCLSFSVDSTAALDSNGWDFQACTEMVMPMCNNESSMFEPIPWNFTAFSDECFEKYGARPRRDWAVTEYGGARLRAASNIIFSNGDLDPWSGGGVLFNVSDSVLSLMVANGAHHYDLRGKHPDDTQAVKNVRRTERSYIEKWMTQFRQTYQNYASFQRKSRPLVWWRRDHSVGQ